jgi:hypothetical protein
MYSIPATEPMAPAKEPAKNFKKKEESDLTPKYRIKNYMD